MNETRKFETIGDLLNDSEFGFVIFHQEAAPGNDFEDDDQEYQASQEKLMQRAHDASSQLRDFLGEPSVVSDEWDLGIPTWASGGGYSLWTRENDFVASFISWDNPEDPGFVIVGRGAIEDFSADHLSPKPDPWGADWMNFGEW